MAYVPIKTEWTIHIKDEKGRLTIPPKTLDEVLLVRRNLLADQGKIITLSNDVEGSLERILRLISARRNKAKSLDMEKLSFMNKFELFHKYIENGFVEVETKEKIDTNLDKIKEIIDIRNAFAHGDIILRDKIPYLRFKKKDGTTREISLEKDYLEKLYATFDEIRDFLHKLNSYFSVLKNTEKKK